MDPQNSDPDYILGINLKVLSRQSFNSLLQFSVATCSILSRQYLFLQHVYSVAIDLSLTLLTLCPARSVVLSILCCDILMCVYWNNYVAALKIVLRHCFYATSSKLCHDCL